MPTGVVPRIGIDVSSVPNRPAGAGRYVIELVRALGQRRDVALELFARRSDSERWRGFTSGEGHVVRGVAPNGRVARVAFGELVLGRVAHYSSPGIDLFHGTHYTVPLATDA